MTRISEQSFATAKQRYLCQNRSCRAEVDLDRSIASQGRNPRCPSCGAEMKMPYAKPEIRVSRGHPRVFDWIADIKRRP